MCLVGASNELPDDGEDLAALYDRFLLRKKVDQLPASALPLLLSSSSYTSQHKPADSFLESTYLSGPEQISVPVPARPASPLIDDETLRLVRTRSIEEVL